MSLVPAPDTAPPPAAALSPSPLRASPPRASPPPEPVVCVLCKYAGSQDNPVVVAIMSYISESAGKVGVGEVSRQARIALNAELGTVLTDGDVETHILSHSLDQRIVLSSILRDLVDIAQTVKHSSVVQDADTGAAAVDTKALLAYLKIVNEIQNIYKMESMKNLSK